MDEGYKQRVQYSEKMAHEHRQNLAQATRRYEIDLFVPSEPKETKYMLLEKRHQRMDEIIKDNAEYGGRYIRK